jgi:phosphate-selective porin OprO/OprP
MFTNAFGNAGAERRIGVSAAYAPKENLNFAAGLFGDNESISRSTGAPSPTRPTKAGAPTARDLGAGVRHRARSSISALSGYYRTALKSGDVEDAVRLSDRPNIRVDNGNIADSGVIPASSRCVMAAPRPPGCSGR